MLEVGSNLEGLLVPEYWRGHGFEDSCAWKDQYERRVIDHDPGAFGKRLDQAAEFAKRVLEEYRKTPERRVVERFSDGQEFDGRKYPPGTLVRLEIDGLTYSSTPWLRIKRAWNKQYAPPIRSSEKWIGVLTNIQRIEPDETILTAVREEILLDPSNAEINPTGGWATRISVGEVEHSRIATITTGFSGLKIYHGLTRFYETIGKTRSVEVLQDTPSLVTTS